MLKMFSKKIWIYLSDPSSCQRFFTTRSIGTERQREMWRYWQDTKLPLLEHERFLWLELDLTNGIPVVPANSQLGGVNFIHFFVQKMDENVEDGGDNDDNN